MGRDVNVRAYVDTMRRCKNDRGLSKTVEDSIAAQKIIRENDALDVPDRNIYIEEAKVIVTCERTLDSAWDYSGESRIAVINSTWDRPGGRVDIGENGQQESLCRCTTLKPCLDALEGSFYNTGSKMESPLFNDDLVYTPDVTVFKSDDLNCCKEMHDTYWFDVDVISCIPPDMSSLADDPSRYVHPRDLTTCSGVRFTMHLEKRLRRILDVALANGCEVVILPAFGCGRAKNPPAEVAEAFVNVIPEYLHAFKVIEVAVYEEFDDKIYSVFDQAIDNLQL